MKKERIKEKIFLIEEELSNISLPLNNVSLFSGLSGLPIFYYMLYEYTNDKKYLKKINDILQRLFDLLNTSDYPISYCNGLTGVAYMLNYLNSKIILEDSIEENLIVIDDIIVDFFSKNTNSFDDLDFLHGSLGAAFYLNSRLKYNQKNEKETLFLFKKLAKIINDYLKESDKVKDVKYFTNDIHRTNLGLAHGIISFIIVFSKFFNNFPKEIWVKDLILACVNCIKRFESKNINDFSKYPSIAVNNNSATYNIPLGWCYGDQAISIGLYKASHVLQDKELEKKAFELAHRNLNRDSIERIFPLPMYDAGFCHGLVSIGYFHKKWYSYSKDKDFYNQYEKFIFQTIEFANKDIGIAGYQKYMGDNKYEDAIGFLDGVIGIGIVLIDYLLIKNDSDWDQFFLLD
jgi:lantibiotic modifying enzyme